MKKILTILGIAAATLAGAQAAVLLNETFTYSNGALATVSSGAWTEFSGTGGENVAGNLLSIDDNGTGDDRRSLSSAVASGTVFVGFDLVSLSSDQPSSTGIDGYFFGFMDGGTSYFNRLVMYRPTGSTSGKYTLTRQSLRPGEM